MRKIGIVCAGLGALIAAALGVLRTTRWFAEESARAMSESAEFVVCFFWAGCVLFIVGLILIARSTYRQEAEVTFEDYLPYEGQPAQPELYWVCPRCGAENPDEAAFCVQCGFQDGTDPNLPAQNPNWQCPRCGCVWNDSASVCAHCGFRRFG